MASAPWRRRPTGATLYISQLPKLSDHQRSTEVPLDTPGAAAMNSIPQFSRRLFERSSTWSCSSCRRAQAQWQRGARRFVSQTGSREAQQSTNSRPQGGADAPGMDRMRQQYGRKNTTTMYVQRDRPRASELVLTSLLSRLYTISIILGTVAFSYGSVPMYKMVYRS